MIKLDQIEEWIHEVEERPSSGPLIIRYVAGRLKDLSSRNEELLAENIALRSGRKVEEYETRIANLEYQLEILKRQMGGEGEFSASSPAVDVISVLVYNIKGQVLRVDVPTGELKSGSRLAGFGTKVDANGPARLLVTASTEELLFVFDSGRTEARPISDIQTTQADRLEWKGAFLAEPRGAEELAVILPIARMTLSDYCVQISRRGCAKKMMKTSFESAVSKTFVGAGIKGKPDKTCTLSLCGKEDVLVLATREGFLLSIDVSQLPYTIEEIIRLYPIDYIASAFIAGRKPSILVVTENGKAINRETGWLEKAASFKSKGQAIFSQARRDAGVRVAGAAAVDENDWGLALDSTGALTLHKISELFAAGSLGGEESGSTILDFTAFSTGGAASTSGAASASGTSKA